MKAINQREQTIESFKFVGIILFALLLMSFMFSGGESVEEQQLDNYKDSLRRQNTQLQYYEEMEKRLTELADYSMEIKSKVGEFDQQLVTFSSLQKDPTQEIAAAKMGQNLDDLISQIGSIKEDVDRVDTEDTTANRIKSILKENYDLIHIELQVRKSRAEGGNNSASEDIINQKQALEDLVAKLQQEKVEAQLGSQIESKTKQVTDCQLELGKKDTEIKNLKALLIDARTLLVTKGPNLLIYSKDVQDNTDDLKEYITKEIKGWRDQKDKVMLIQMLDKFPPISTELKITSDEMAKLSGRLIN